MLVSKPYSKIQTDASTSVSVGHHRAQSAHNMPPKRPPHAWSTQATPALLQHLDHPQYPQSSAPGPQTLVQVHPGERLTTPVLSDPRMGEQSGAS